MSLDVFQNGRVEKFKIVYFKKTQKRMMGDMSSVLEEVFYYLPVYSVC